MFFWLLSGLISSLFSGLSGLSARLLSRTSVSLISLSSSSSSSSSGSSETVDAEASGEANGVLSLSVSVSIETVDGENRKVSVDEPPSGTAVMLGSQALDTWRR